MMRSRLGVLLLLAASVGMPVAAALFKVWVYQDAVALGYRLSEREQQKKQLANTLQQLEVELAAERAPSHLLQLARKLGLSPPAPEQLLGKIDAHGGRHGRP